MLQSFHLAISRYAPAQTCTRACHAVHRKQVSAEAYEKVVSVKDIEFKAALIVAPKGFATTLVSAYVKKNSEGVCMPCPDFATLRVCRFRTGPLIPAFCFFAEIFAVPRAARKWCTCLASFSLVLAQLKRRGSQVLRFLSDMCICGSSKSEREYTVTIAATLLYRHYLI